jgi:hypothetical protein
VPSAQAIVISVFSRLPPAAVGTIPQNRSTHLGLFRIDFAHREKGVFKQWANLLAWYLQSVSRCDPNAPEPL